MIGWLAASLLGHDVQLHYGWPDLHVTPASKGKHGAHKKKIDYEACWQHSEHLVFGLLQCYLSSTTCPWVVIFPLLHGDLAHHGGACSDPKSKQGPMRETTGVASSSIDASCMLTKVRDRHGH